MASSKFQAPQFGDKQLELRCEKDEIAIYATEDGLRKLAELCRLLLAEPQRQHLHLEDYSILSANSLKGTLALFPTKS